MRDCGQGNVAWRLVVLLMALLLPLGGMPSAQEGETREPLLVVTKPVPPFVMREGSDAHLTGFSVEVWRLLAERGGWAHQWRLVGSIPEMLNAVRHDSADLAIAAISMTARREGALDFSHPYFESGLQVLARVGEGGQLAAIWRSLWDVLRAPAFSGALAAFMAVLLAMAHVFWLLERRHNPQISERYLPGLWDAFWWALVTVSTVGYGDKVPMTHAGRTFAVAWIIFGYIGFATFTAVVASTVTVRQMTGVINGPESLSGHRVGVVRGGTAGMWLMEHVPGARLVRFMTVEEAVRALREERVVAVVHDAPVLAWQAARNESDDLRLVGPVFRKENYAIAFPEGSPLREQVNRLLLQMREDGTLARLRAQWFGGAR